MPKLLASPMVSTALYALSVLMMRGISFVMFPYVANRLSPSQFGELELLTTYAVLGSVVLSFGLEHALYRFSGQATDQAKRQIIASHIYSLCVVIGGIVLLTNCILLTTFDIPWVFHVIGLTLALETLISVPLGWLRMNNRSLAFCFASVLRAALQATLLVTFLHAGRGIAGVFEASFIAAFIVAILLYALNAKSLSFVITKHGFIPFLKYGIPLVGSGLLAFFLNGFDRWLLASETSLAVLANYAIAAKFALLVTLALQPFGMWFMPKRFELLNGQFGRARSTHWAMVGIHLCLFLTLGVGLTAALFITYFLPSGYQAAVVLLPLCVAWACCKELSEFVNIGCFVGENTHQQLIINIVATVLGVTTMWITAPSLAAQGILFGLFVAQLARFSLFYTVGKKYIDLQLPIARISLLLALVIALTFWQNQQVSQSLPLLLAKAMASTLIYGLVAAALFPHDCRRLLRCIAHGTRRTANA